MRKILTIAGLALCFCAAARGQSVAPCNGNVGFAPQCKDSQTITTSGNSIKIYGNGGLAFAAEEVIAGSPSTVSIVIAGCGDSGTCTTLDYFMANFSGGVSLVGWYQWSNLTHNPGITDATGATLTPAGQAMVDLYAALKAIGVIPAAQ